MWRSPYEYNVAFLKYDFARVVNSLHHEDKIIGALQCSGDLSIPSFIELCRAKDQLTPPVKYFEKVQLLYTDANRVNNIVTSIIIRGESRRYKNIRTRFK